MSLSRTICLVQARLGSRRLPAKILSDIAGKPMLQRVCERASQIPGVDQAAIVTAWGDQCAIREAVPGWLVLAYPIPEDDVLTRFAWAATALGADWIVRVTGDCPRLDSEVGGRVLRAAQKANGYATNDTRVSGYPDGWDVQAFPVATLLDASVHAIDLADREHVCLWMDRQPRVLVMADQAYPQEKVSVDTLEDLERARATWRADLC